MPILGTIASSFDNTPIQRAVYGGGSTGSNTNVIDYVSIMTLGNATDFGDLLEATNGTAACSSSTRGLFGGGYTTGNLNVIQYITIDSTGNATDFGDLTVARERPAGASSSTRGLFTGGNSGDSPWYNTIDYVTIATTGNAIDFGDMTTVRATHGATASPTRALMAAGFNLSVVTNTIDYVTIASTGNATNFGNLITGRDNAVGAVADSTRACFAGGSAHTGSGNFSNIAIDYVTISTTGNATNFGNLTTGNSLAGAAGLTRGLFFGNRHSPTTGQNVIDYITIQTTGNAADFGDMTLNKFNGSACSNAHGGL